MILFTDRRVTIYPNALLIFISSPGEERVLVTYTLGSDRGLLTDSHGMHNGPGDIHSVKTSHFKSTNYGALRTSIEPTFPTAVSLDICYSPSHTRVVQYCPLLLRDCIRRWTLGNSCSLYFILYLLPWNKLPIYPWIACMLCAHGRPREGDFWLQAKVWSCIRFEKSGIVPTYHGAVTSMYGISLLVALVLGVTCFINSPLAKLFIPFINMEGIFKTTGICYVIGNCMLCQL